MSIRKYVVCILAATLAVGGGFAQTVKTVTVSQAESYTDHISLAEDAKDKDLMVKFVFNENENTLTVSLITYRNLFVFWDNVPYKPLIKGRTIRPDMLPYVVTYEPTDKYKISKEFQWSIPFPQKNFSFTRWIEYDGLQPVAQEYKMVNDYVSQTFDILNKRSAVTVRLRDILLMDDVSKSDQKKRYVIPYGRDLYTEYQVIINRDPCYGMEQDIQSAKQALESITTSYKSLHSKYGSGVVNSKESLAMFNNMKDLLLQQYPQRNIDTSCPDLQTAWGKYNGIVESVRQMECVVRSSSSKGGMGMSASVLMNKAKQIDKAVARWLVSDDEVERRDIVMQCQALIKEVHASGLSGGTAEQMNAVRVFRAAEHYFTITCFGR